MTESIREEDAPAGQQVAALGLATVVASGPQAGTVLDVWYPAPRRSRTPDESPREGLEQAVAQDPARNVEQQVVSVVVDLDAAPMSTEDVYLRLHALSHRLVAPNQVNLEGIFGHLATVAWTSAGPILAAELEERRPGLRRAGHLTVFSVDKFPRMVDYVVPSGVRIGDASRVRLGAYLSEGTTVMHEGFINFNAGTLGSAMVEGRISQGVVVGDHTDVGGGASIMGTLSGGGTQRVSLGERVLLGANAGVGISLGDDCVVEAGLYLTAGTRVSVAGDQGPRVVKALELSGISGLLFRRNSQTGAVEALGREGESIALNDALHQN